MSAPLPRRGHPAYQRRMPDAAGDRYLVVKGDQGLGNRILSLLSALLLARLSGRRLVVDWRDPFYSADGRDAFAELFALRAPTLPPDRLPDTDAVRPAVWRGHLHLPASAMRARLLGPVARGPRAWRALCVDLDRVDHCERVLVFTCYHERIDALRPLMTDATFGELRRLSTDQILRHLWDDELRLAPVLQERVEAFRRAHLDRACIGVHVRASDRRTRIEAIEATAARLVAEDPRRRLLVATDNADVLRRYVTRFRDVVATEKWYPPPGEAMHWHPSRPDPLQDAADAVVDLHLLAACDWLVLDGRSSFGRLAALRSRAERGRILDLHPGRLLPAFVRRSLLRVRDEVVGRRLARKA